MQSVNYSLELLEHLKLFEQSAKAFLRDEGQRKSKEQFIAEIDVLKELLDECKNLAVKPVIQP
jgi:predicted transcriptional regulator